MTANRSASVLRNRGVCVTVNETIEVDGVWEVARDEKGSPKTTQAWVRFDGNSLADLEDGWGDLEKFQEATGANPYKTVRRTLAIVFGWDDLHPPVTVTTGSDGKHIYTDPHGRLCGGCRRAGLAMREGGLTEYSTAVGAALALANGLDPTKVSKMIDQGAKAIREAEQKRDDALDEMLAATETDTSTSTAGSVNGSEPVAATTSSGG